MLRVAIATCIAFSAPAFGQYFQSTWAQQSAWYFLSVENPDACSGLWDQDGAESFSAEPFSASWSRAFRCLAARGSASGGMWSRVTPTSIACHMVWNGELSADQPVADGLNILLTNASYYLLFDIPSPMRVHVEASVFLDFDAVIDPGEDDGATITLRFGTGRPGEYIQLHTHDGSGHGNPSFDGELTLSAGEGGLVMDIFNAALQQVTSIRTGAEHFQAIATFRMDVIPCPGDIDFDNAVGISDLAVLLANLGGPGDRPDGDLNGDQLVDISYLTEMLSHFGASCDP